MWNRLLKDEKGFTGLEAAIVLVAFVVVAAVFSYVMLGAGFYTTQKSQEVVHTGVTQASSSIAPSGEVIVEGMAGNKATKMTFYITSTAGGTPVDLDKTIVTYTDANEAKTFDKANGAWSYTTVISKSGGSANLLETAEKIKIVLTLSGKVDSEPVANEVVQLEVKPPEGAVLIISRTMPPALAADTYYPVY
jgi:flagellin FlaB